MLFTDMGFGTDWLMHAWYLWHQSLTIRANHFPSLFINYSHSVFYPEYAFYGGTVTALAGTLSLLLGNAPMETYILTYCIGFAAAYGGWYWMARMAGLGSWQSHVPGFVFITSASYLTILYGRGDWPEFIGVSAIPLMTAAGLSVLRADRLRILPAVALAGSGIVFFGSHSMTTLWGTTFLALVGLAILVCVPQARQEITGRGVIRVTIVLVPALLANAWFLLPETAYEARTLIGSGYQHGALYWKGMLERYMPLVAAGRLFTFSRATSGSETSLVFSLPVLVIVWVSVGAVMLLRVGSRGAWMRALVIFAGATILSLIVMTHAGIITALPRPYTILQFSYRLESYVLLGLSGAVLAVLVLARRNGTAQIKLWTWTLTPVLLVSLVGVIQQLGTLPTEKNRDLILRSYQRALPPEAKSALALEDYDDIDRPSLEEIKTRPPGVTFPPTAVSHDHVSEIVHLPPGDLANSNVAGGPELVHVTGARIVGLDVEGNDVLEIDRRPGDASRRNDHLPTETLSLSVAQTLPVVLGRLLTLIAVAVLATEFAVLVARRVTPARTARRAIGTRSFRDPEASRREGSSRRSSRS
jgi:hypothetical protein